MISFYKTATFFLDMEQSLIIPDGETDVFNIKH